MPRLPGQRVWRPSSCLRRGAASSHIAIAASTALKAVNRTKGSFDITASIFNNSLE